MAREGAKAGDAGLSADQVSKAGEGILKRRLTQNGWKYDEVETRGPNSAGYDLRVKPPGGKWRCAEIKTGQRLGWLEPDIRKCVSFRWSNNSTGRHLYLDEARPRPALEMNFDLSKIPFDVVFVVTNVGSRRPVIYYYTRDEVLRLPKTALTYKGFLRFRLGKQHEREPYRWPRADGVV